MMLEIERRITALQSTKRYNDLIIINTLNQFILSAKIPTSIHTKPEILSSRFVILQYIKIQHQAYRAFLNMKVIYDRHYRWSRHDQHDCLAFKHSAGKK